MGKNQIDGKDPREKYNYTKPELKDHAYIQAWAARNAIHEPDRERAGAIVHNLRFDKNDPEIKGNPIFIRKLKEDPVVAYDEKSLYLCG